MVAPVHDFRHNARIYVHSSIDSVEIGPDLRQRHRIESAGELPLDLLVLPRSSRRLVVAFHGALSPDTTPPRFQYLRSLEPRSESLLFIADPLLSVRPEVGLAWYVGTAEQPAVSRIAELVRAIAQRLGAVETVLVGHSGGGFAAAAIGLHVENSISLLLNAQTRIVAYEEWAVERFRLIAFPECDSIEDLQNRFAPRLDLTSIYQSQQANNHMLLALQTRGDQLHWSQHWQPFAKSLGVPSEGGVSLDGRFVFRPADWGETHAGPASISPYIDDAFALLEDSLGLFQRPTSGSIGASSGRPPSPRHQLESTETSAIVLPHIYGTQQCGIVPAEGIPAFAAHRRWNKERLAPVPGFSSTAQVEDWGYSGASDAIEGDFWYSGVMDRHFGHFVTESISRVWWHLTNVGHGRRALVVPYGTSDWNGEHVRLAPMPAWQQQVFDYFGICDPLYVDRPASISNLLIPEQGAILFGDFHSESHRAALADYDRRINGERSFTGKVFLRRPDSHPSVGVVGEDAFSEVLLRAGYLEVYPANYSIREQLSIVRSASHVVSVEGSGLHLFNLLGNSPDTHVLSLQRLSDWSSQAFSRSVRPYVGSLTVAPVALRFASEFSSAKDVVVPDLRRLPELFEAFDSAVDVSRFDHGALYAAMLRALSPDSTPTVFAPKL